MSPDTGAEARQLQLSDGTTAVLSTASSDEAMEAIVRGRVTVTGGILTLTIGDQQPLLLLLPRDTMAVAGEPAGISIRGAPSASANPFAAGGVTRASSLLPDELPPAAADRPVVALSSIDSSN